MYCTVDQDQGRLLDPAGGHLLDEEVSSWDSLHVRLGAMDSMVKRLRQEKLSPVVGCRADGVDSVHEPIPPHSSGLTHWRRQHAISDCTVGGLSCSITSVPSCRADDSAGRLAVRDHYPRSRSSSSKSLGRDCSFLGPSNEGDMRQDGWPVVDGRAASEIKAILEEGYTRCQLSRADPMSISRSTSALPIPATTTDELRRALSEIVVVRTNDSMGAHPHKDTRFDATHADGEVTLHGNPCCSSARQSRSQSRERCHTSQFKRALSTRTVYGPERFFYDESTFTGVHRHGGPSTIDKCGVTMFSHLSEMTRPHLKSGGGTFVSSRGDVLSKKSPSAFLAPLREGEVAAPRKSHKLNKTSSPLRGLSPDRNGSHTSTGVSPRAQCATGTLDADTATDVLSMSDAWQAQVGPATSCSQSRFAWHSDGVDGVSGLHIMQHISSGKLSPQSAARSAATQGTVAGLTRTQSSESLHGPARFYLDKSTYTGIHRRGQS